MKKVAIIIPAYNEERRIGRTLEAYSQYFEKLKEDNLLDYLILIVINNTKDNTEGIVTRYTKKNLRIKYLNLIKGGKGYATIEGFKQVIHRDFDLIGFVDADMATSPEEYYKLILNINDYDGIIADRYLPSSKIIPSPTIQRLIAKRLFNFVIRSMLFLPFGDTQCGAKIFKRKAIEKTMPLLTMSQWAFDVELLYLLKKGEFKVKSSPTIWIDKEYSKINFWKAGPWMTLGVLRLRIINSPFKRFLKIYDKLIGFIPR